MYATSLDGVAWDLLTHRIDEGLCVPFLGAGVNVASTTPAYIGLPLGGELAGSIADALAYPPGSTAELARVALEYETRADRPLLVALLKREIADAARDPSPLLRALARLPLRLYVTTNYDHLLERALEEAGRDFRVIVQPAAGFINSKAVEEGFAALEEYLDAEGGTVVYKIHGTFRARTLPVHPADQLADDDDPVIITEDDYIDFLTVLQSSEETIGVPKLVRSRLTPSSLLFLGYGLQDWDFRTLHRGIVQRLTKHQQRRSLAIQRKPPKYWVNYWAPRGVDIYDVDLYRFGKQLLAKYEAAQARP